ncbi:MAG: apolipoprotein N-acyltransferase, partial [Candidatus Omnitrophica bacterium]|nr:apolipoprotein N-acyltransferase [Candidatus Omnitrophota bacterium]
PVSISGTLLFVAALSIQPLVFLTFYRRENTFLNLIYVSSLWVASEWLRTILLNGFCFSLGYSQSFLPQMAQLASLGGSYAVAFVIVMVNGGLYSAVVTREKRAFYLSLAAIIFAANFMYGTSKLLAVHHDRTPVMVAGIQPNIPRHDKLNPNLYDSNIETHITLTTKALQVRKADLIIWPETAFPWDLLNDPVWHGRIKQLVRNSQTFFLLGVATFRNDQNFNSALMFSPGGNLEGVTHKNHLVPFCEYFPKIKIFQWLQDRLQFAGFDFTAGKQKQLFSMGLVRFGVLICSESCYPQTARRLSQNGSDFIVVMLNDGWFDKPAAMMIHAQNAVMRAIETGRDFISVANTGWTFRADHHGMVSAFLSLQRQETGIFPAIPRESQTVYARIGDIFSAACLLFVIITAFLRNKIYKRS